MTSWLTRDWARPMPSSRQLRHDVLIGIVLALIAVGSVSVFRSAMSGGEPIHGNESYWWFAAAGGVLGFRRRFPLTVLVVESVIFIVVGERFEDLAAVFSIQMMMFAALYAAWAWSRRVVELFATTAIVLLTMFGWLGTMFLRDDGMPPDTGGASGSLLPQDTAIIVYTLAVNIVYFFGAIAWGQAAWLSARRRALLEAQFERERGHQEVERRQAVRAEQMRIARDLHDVVAHHVSSIGIQATGARRVLARDPDRAAEALATIENTSREAVTQMHQLVGLLRDGDRDDTHEGASREPQPGLCDVLTLADAHGPPRVAVDVVGQRYDVSGTVALNLYRIAQEAVTNARRHAHAKLVHVTLRYLDDAVEIEIIDDGRGANAAGEPGGIGGYGLEGIRERTAMLGGHLELGNRPETGFRVRVRAPRPTWLETTP